MAVLTEYTIDNGSIIFRKAVDGSKPTIRKEGNVTIHTNGTQAVPPYYEVSHFITANWSEGPLTFTNNLTWYSQIPSEDDAQPYRETEGAAARQIALMLRQLADKIEADVTAFDRERESQGGHVTGTE